MTQIISSQMERLKRARQHPTDVWQGGIFRMPGWITGQDRALDAPGVTLDRMRAFADAAAEYYRAALWNHLSDADPVRVESEVPDPALSHFVVVGGTGKTRGLAFMESMEQYEALLEVDVARELSDKAGLWSLEYGPVMFLPLPDADLWEDRGLSVASPEAYPLLICQQPGESYVRPDAGTLAYVEGLLRALAQTTEDEMDGGRWTKRVTTAESETEVTLALPDILEPPPLETDGQGPASTDRWSMERALRDIGRMLENKKFDSVDEINSFMERELAGKPLPEPKPRNPEERAQELFYQATGAFGRMQIKLARQALELYPDCADAHVLLAQRMPDNEKRLELYRKGVRAGERALGEKAFKEDVGHFWGITGTRPYMRALAALAAFLESLGRVEEAIEHYRKLLRLNPHDNQGIRFSLIPLLLGTDKDAEAERLLDEFADDVSAPIAYARALLTFRKQGDSPEARRHLEKAIKANPHMIKLLIKGGELPVPDFDSYTPGSKEEAVAYASEALAAWERTPGAVRWLKSRRKARKKSAADKRKKRGRK
jgi:tetratricopeptide (TPR) repeat protein